jgi:glycosyltransferase involved in cell wall biosynthesis
MEEKRPGDPPDLRGTAILILSVAFPFAPVSTDAVGGAEQIVALLDRAIIASGHRSIVVACEGSRVDGRLIAPLAGTREWREAIDTAVAYHNIDIVHMHGLDFVEYLPAEGPPVLATLHLPISFYRPDVFHIPRPRTWLNCVSGSQLRNCPPCVIVAGAVENGVRVEEFAGAPRTAGGYVFAMGRICEEKGFHFALDAADRAGTPLWLAGQVFPYESHLRYWREALAPRLRSPHRFLGAVGFREKAALLAGATCLLAPSTVAETSSLVAMEAMACGTPVVAFRSGALSELIEPGRTGFLVDNVNEMAEAIVAAARLDSEACREVARRRFDAARMAARYMELYDRLLTAHTDSQIEIAGVSD